MLFEDQDGKLMPVALDVGEGDSSGFELQMRNFLEGIRGEAALVNNADQAVALMEMLDAIYASSELGREVPIA